MPTPIRGYAGSLTISGVTINWAGNWEANLETEEVEIGPFIGDNGTVYTFTTNRRLTGTVEVTVPSGKDSGQTVLLTAAQNGNELPIVLTTTGGYTINIPSGIILNFSMSQDAGESVTASFDFRSSGSFTIS